jgi:hypothetical protein
MEVRTYDIPFRQVVVNSEGEINHPGQKIIKFLYAVFSECFFKDQQRILVFFLRQQAKNWRRGLFNMSIEGLFLFLQCYEIACLYKRLHTLVKVIDNGRIFVDPAISFYGMIHNAVEFLFGGFQIIEPEEGFHPL